MPIEVIDFSFVVIADGHNPTILHPYFMKNEEIVPKNWGDGIEYVATPPFSKIDYGNGVEISVEQTKLQVLDKNGNQNIDENTESLKITKKYTEKLPFVNYRAVGFNILAFNEGDNWLDFIKNNFVKDEVFKKLKEPLIGLATIFKWELDQNLVTITVDYGKIKKKDKPERKGLVLKANYHKPIKEPKESYKEVLEHLNLSPKDFKDFNDRLNILGLTL